MSRPTQLLLAMLTLALFPMIGPGAASGQQSPDADQAVRDCVAQNGGISLLFLMDESASLQRNDPANVRVDAVESALRALEIRTKVDGLASPVRVSVAFGGFGVGYRNVLDWTSVRPDTMPSILNAAREFDTAPRNHDTDYVEAIAGAGADLASAPETCRVLLWFTDGRFDLDSNNRASVLGSEATTKGWILAADVRNSSGDSVDLRRSGDADIAMAAGRDLICRPGGLADVVRSTGAVTFPIGLSIGEALPEGERGFLSGVADGSTLCGVNGGPATGRLLLANDVGELVRVFAEVVLPPGEPIERTLTLDPLVGRVLVLLERGDTATPVLVRGPLDGVAQLDFTTESSQRIDGVDFRSIPVSGQVVILDMAPDPTEQGWVGDWEFEFEPTRPADAAVSAYFFLAAGLRVDDSIRLRSGTPVDVGIEVVNAAGIAIDPSAVQLIVSLSADGGPSTPLDTSNGAWRTSIVAADGAGEVSFVAQLDVVPQANRSFEPVVARFRLPVDLPAGFIDVGSLGAVDLVGDDPQTLTIPLSAGPESAGCVRLAAVRARDQLVTSSAGAAEVCLDSGDTSTVTFDLVATSPAIAVDQVEIELIVSSELLGETRTITRTVDVSLDKPVDEGRRLLVFVGLMAAGILFPLLLLLVLSRILGRHRRVDDLRVAETRIELDGQGRLVVAGSDHFALAAEHHRFGQVSKRSARTVVVAGTELRVKVPINPFRSPYVEAAQSGMRLFGRYPASRGRVRLPLVLGRDWWVAPASDGSASGSLFTVVRHNEDIEDVARQVGQFLPNQLKAAAAQAASEATATQAPGPQFAAAAAGPGSSAPSAPSSWQPDQPSAPPRPPSIDLGGPSQTNTARPPEWKP